MRRLAPADLAVLDQKHRAQKTACHLRPEHRDFGLGNHKATTFNPSHQCLFRNTKPVLLKLTFAKSELCHEAANLWVVVKLFQRKGQGIGQLDRWIFDTVQKSHQLFVKLFSHLIGDLRKQRVHIWDQIIDGAARDIRLAGKFRHRNAFVPFLGENLQSRRIQSVSCCVHRFKSVPSLSSLVLPVFAGRCNH